MSLLRQGRYVQDTQANRPPAAPYGEEVRDGRQRRQARKRGRLVVETSRGRPPRQPRPDEVMGHATVDCIVSGTAEHTSESACGFWVLFYISIIPFRGYYFLHILFYYYHHRTQHRTGHGFHGTGLDIGVWIWGGNGQKKANWERNSGVNSFGRRGGSLRYGNSGDRT